MDKSRKTRPTPADKAKRQEQKDALSVQRDFTRLHGDLLRLHVYEVQGILDGAHRQQKERLERAMERFIESQQHAGMDVESFRERWRAIATSRVPPVDPAMLEFFKSTGRTPARAAAIGGAVGGPPPPKRLKSGSDEDTLDLALVALPQGPAPASAYDDPPIPIPIRYNLRLDVPKAEAEDEIDEVEEAEAIDEVQEAEKEEEEERIEQDDAAAVTRNASNADEAPKKKDERAPTMLPSATVIAARPVLRDLMREVTSMVPSALRRRQAVKPEIIAAAPLAKATIAPAAPGTLTAPTLSAVAPALSAVAPTTIISHSSAAHRSKRKLITAAPDLSDDNEEEEEYAQQLSLSDRLRLGVVGRDSAKASSVASAAPQSGDADAAYKDLLKELGESS